MSSSLFSNSQSPITGQSQTSQMAANKLKPLTDMYKLFQTAQDPMSMLKDVAVNSTEFGDILQMTQAANGDPKQAFYARAKSMGLTDQQINDGLSSMESALGIKRPN